MSFDRFQSDRAEPQPEKPAFRDWADDPENDLAAERIVANFIADEGVDMMRHLISGGSAAGYLTQLERMFDRWWDEGQPSLPDHPRVLVSPWIPELERRAHAFLDAHLPPAASYSVFTRRRKLAGGKSEEVGWFCSIYDGPASSGGQGASPLAAAQAAVAAWKEFISGPVRTEILEGTPFEIFVEDESDEQFAKPPMLDAPSAPRSSEEQSDRKIS